MGQNGPQNINYSTYGHTFFGHNSSIFLSNRAAFFLVTQETIIYRLMMRNHDFDAFLEKIVFLVGQPLSLKLVFNKFESETPLKGSTVIW